MWAYARLRQSLCSRSGHTPAPRPSGKQRNTDGEKREIKAGRIPAEWAKKPAKLRQKDRDARWTVKSTTAKPSMDGLVVTLVPKVLI